MIRVEKNDIRSEATKKLASLLYNDSQFAYFDLNIENVHGDKEALIDFSYSKKTDVNIFNLILN
jgi:uncharacterized protein YdgA (DUF945 family)